MATATPRTCVLAFLAAAALLGGCTRFRPVTNLRENALALPDTVRIARTLVVVDHDSVDVGGGHHDGLVQAPQVWIFGLSDEQKKTLYSNVGLLSTVALVSEMKRQGVPVEVVKNGDQAPPTGHEYLLMLTVKEIRLDTYGSWMAGDYWDSNVRVRVAFSNRRTGAAYWMSDFEGYAKLEPCPAKFDWVDLIQKQLMFYAPIPSIPGVSGIAKVQKLKDGFDYRAFLDAFTAKYDLDTNRLSPVEVASRGIARDIVAKIASIPP